MTWSEEDRPWSGPADDKSSWTWMLLWCFFRVAIEPGLLCSVQGKLDAIWALFRRGYDQVSLMRPQPGDHVSTGMETCLLLHSHQIFRSFFCHVSVLSHNFYCHRSRTNEVETFPRDQRDMKTITSQNNSDLVSFDTSYGGVHYCSLVFYWSCRRKCASLNFDDVISTLKPV